MTLITSILNSLVYDASNPLLFTSIFFMLFLLIILAIYPFVVNKVSSRVWFLLIVSLYFYYKTSGVFVLLLLATALVNYFLGFLIYNSRSKGVSKAYLFCSLIWNLGTLGYFKYTNFLFQSINGISGSSFPMYDIILPVGISFFTFQTWSYTLDIYFKKLEPVKSFADFTFFVAFFPQLVAGPIVRASYFLPQIRKPLHISDEDIARAMVLILSGLLKKGVLADYLSTNFVDRVFENPALFSGLENLLGVYAYAIQIYCDFSGYSDIAIGVALLMGFSLPINFNSPYTATSITDFWRRWHISLSTWLRDYLYIPLGGNRKGKMRQYTNLMATMLLGGLWHGASWNFVFWGFLHGLGLSFDKWWLSRKIAENKLMKWLGVILTFHYVCLGWVFFRAGSFNNAWIILSRIFGAFNAKLFSAWIVEYRIPAILIALGFITHWLPQKWDAWWEEVLGSSPVFVKATALAFVIWILFQARSADIQPFIYFQF